MSEKYIVMLGTSTRTRGGVAAAINAYANSELSRRWPIRHIATHSDGAWWRKFAFAVRAYFHFLALLLVGKISVVHVHSASDASFWRKTFFMACAFAARRPVIFHLHGGGFVDFYRHRAGRWGRPVVEFVLGRAARIVVLSDQWAQRMATITQNLNIVVIPNTIPEASERPRAAIIRNTTTLLFLGRLEKEKGIYDLLLALNKLQREGMAIKVLLGGEGDEAAVRKRARELGLESSLEFLGWIAGERKQEALARASVFVLPSYIENMPVSLLEAMAASLPVIATRVGGIPDVVEEGVTGLLIAPGDSLALAAAIRKLMTDPARRERMGEAGYRRFETHYSTERVIPRLEALYRELGAQARTVTSITTESLPREVGR